jgi:hypothetical protein
MQGHFGHLHFNNFPMTLETPQGEVFCPLLLNSKDSGVPEDSKSPTLGMWVSSSHWAKVGLRHIGHQTLEPFKGHQALEPSIGHQALEPSIGH